jgi:hypothetical protein
MMESSTSIFTIQGEQVVDWKPAYAPDRMNSLLSCRLNTGRHAGLECAGTRR